MPVTITINGQTASESLFELSQLAMGFMTKADTPVAVAFPADEPTEAKEEAAPAELVTPKPETPKKTRKAKDAPQISANPENRVDPEVAKQDAADEVAEAAQQPAAPTATHEDIRAVLGAYGRLYGMEAAMEDGPGIIGVKKISDLSETQIPEALARAKAALEGNPNQRTPVTA